MPIDVYLKAIQIMKSVEAYLRSSECPIELERKDSTNVKFYIAMVVAYKLVSSTENLEKKLSELPNVVISNDLLTFGFNLVWQQYQTLGGNDQVAKGVELLKSIKVELSGTS
jgi:hypothetical protein